MKWTHLYLLFFLKLTISVSQSKIEIDSLNNCLANLQSPKSNYKSDTSRIRILSELNLLKLIVQGDTSEMMLNQALELAEYNKWQDGKYLAFYNLGLTKISKLQYMGAIDYFYKALENTNKNDQRKTAIIYRQLGDCYSLIGNFDKAVYYNKKSLILFFKLRDLESFVRGKINLGLAYFDKKDFLLAKQTFQFGLELNKKTKFQSLNDLLLANLSYSESELGNLDKAFKTLDSLSRKPFSALNYPYIKIFTSLSEISLKKREYAKSKAYLEKAATLIEKYQAINDGHLDYNRLSYRLFYSLGDFKNAFIHLEKYHQLDIEKTNQSAKERIEALEYNFQNNQKSQEIGQLRRNLIFGAVVMGLIVLMVVILVVFLAKLKLSNKIIQNQKADIEKANNLLEKKVEERTKELSEANKELIVKNFEISEALFKGKNIERKRVATQLHDNLGSTLSAVKWRLEAIDLEGLSAEEQSIYNGIKAMISTAYQDVRNISHELLPASLQEFGLEGALQKLIDDLNQNGKKEFRIDFDGSFDNFGKKLALEIFSIISELITNILKHSEATVIELMLENNSSTILIFINDNGQKYELKDGMGTSNILDRIQNLSGSFEIMAMKNWNNSFKISLPVVFTQ